MSPIKVLKRMLLTMKHTRSSRRRAFHGEFSKGYRWERQCSSWMVKDEGSLDNPKEERVIPARAEAERAAMCLTGSQENQTKKPPERTLPGSM